MSTGPVALFDVERLRALRRPTLGVLHRDRPTVVLGSTQRAAAIDAARLARDGIATARRRGGGGAVLLRPDDCWIELWLPRPHDGGDLRGTACEIGECWAAALGQLGVVGDVHRGPVINAEQGALACFAGLGPGEITVAGAKLVGLSQWRSREGALVSSVLARRPPAELSPYLASSAQDTPALAHATCLANLEVTLERDVLAGTFASAVAATHPDLDVSALAFA